LQIRAIPRVSLWFAPSLDQKSIGFKCAIKNATLRLAQYFLAWLSSAYKPL
jgi:hypothetical protein